MHKEILTKEQEFLLPLIKKFSKSFGLVGGTAIALHIGHRRSIDFDLFSMKPFSNLRLKRVVTDFVKIDEELVSKKGEYTFFVRGVKITFYHFPFTIPFTEKFEGAISLPDLKTLAAMKAYALGQRAKWKDYVDLYFIIRDYYKIPDIVARTEELFGKEFNEKMFLAQLSYFEDINYSEPVEFLPGFEVADEVVKKGLVDFALSQ